MTISLKNPNISGRLYNCSINCSLPSIMSTLQNISLEEDDALQTFPYIHAYQDLKSCFETWHSIQTRIMSL